MVELPRQKVVHIGTGEVREAVVTRDGEVWWPEHLRKDGYPSLNRHRDGRMVGGIYSGSPQVSQFAPYEAARETEADVFRKRLAQLRSKVAETENSLLGLYQESGEPQGRTV